MYSSLIKKYSNAKTIETAPSSKMAPIMVKNAASTTERASDPLLMLLYTQHVTQNHMAEKKIIRANRSFEATSRREFTTRFILYYFLILRAVNQQTRAKSIPFFVRVERQNPQKSRALYGAYFHASVLYEQAKRKITSLLVFCSSAARICFAYTSKRETRKRRQSSLCAWKESNFRPLSYQDSVLPLNYTRIFHQNIATIAKKPFYRKQKPLA